MSDLLNWADKINSPQLADFIAKYGAQYCMSAEEINEMRDAVNTMGLIQQSVCLGPAEPTDTPTGSGRNYWEVIVPGTYTNFGGVVLPANNRGLIYRDEVGAFSISYSALDLSSFPKLVVGKNLFNKDNLIDGKYVDYSSGVLPSAANQSVTNLIEILPSTAYFCNNCEQVAFYDENQTYISGVLYTNSFTTPATAKYLRLSMETVNIGTAQLELGSANTFYVPYEKSILESVIPISIPRKNTNSLENYYTKTTSEIIFPKLVVGKNLFNKDNLIDGKYVDYSSGGLPSAANQSVTNLIEILPSTAYFCNNCEQVAFYDENQTYISGVLYTNSFTTPATAKYLRLSMETVNIGTAQLELGSIATEYAPYKMVVSVNNIEFIDTNAVTEIEIIVSADTTSSYTFKGKNAIQNAIDSITDATAKKTYTIRVLNGIYKVTNSSEFLGWLGYPAMVLMKDYVSIVGESKEGVIIWAELPYDDASIDVSANGSTLSRELHQTIWNYAKEAYIKNVTVVAKNIRYAIHQDNPLSARSSRYYENVNLQFIGDKGFLNCFGLGTANGEKNFVKNGKAIASVGYPFACHNNTNFKYPSHWEFDNFEFVAENGDTSIILNNCGSLQNDTLILNNCSFSGKGYVLKNSDLYLQSTIALASYNHAEWRVLGGGNDKFLWKNDVLGLSLKITSLSTGDNSKVRFDEASTAIDLVKNPRGISPSDVLTSYIQKIDSYTAYDGSLGLKGYAFGEADISEDFIPYTTTNYVSLGHRLGNCSAVNKNLIINIDGTNRTVVFDKNYTAFTNAAIIAEINAVISAYATASEYCYGRDYYPELADVMEISLNESTTIPILKGTVVSFFQGRVYPAQDGDKIHGVALENIPVYSNSNGETRGYGRVLKRGYISTDTAESHYVLASKQAVRGDNFKVVNGQLLADINGNIKTIDAGVVSIN